MTIDANSIPRRSLEGQAALDVFYDEFNDINFYVEDEEQENLYEVILRKMFPDLKIARIFPLGGKIPVVQHASDPTNAITQPFRAYIVDKDLDDFLARVVALPNLFYLDRYCIENYLLDEIAIVELVVENHPKIRRTDIADALAIPSQIPIFLSSLRPLFALFFCVQYFNLGIPNCGAAAERYCVAARRWELDPNALTSYSDEVVAAARQRAIDPELSDPLDDTRTAAVLLADAHHVVSGKYVCAMLHHYIKSKFGLGSMTFASFVYRLAKNSTLASLLPVAQRIATAAGATNPILAKRLRIAQ